MVFMAQKLIMCVHYNNSKSMKGNVSTEICLVAFYLLQLQDEELSVHETDNEVEGETIVVSCEASLPFLLQIFCCYIQCV